MAQTERSRKPGTCRFLRRTLSPAALSLIIVLCVAAVSARQDIPTPQRTTASGERRFEVASVKQNQQTLAEFISANQGKSAEV